MPAAPTETPRPPRPSRAPVLAMIALALAAAVGALCWIDARQRIGSTEEELAHRLRDIEVDAREARSIARRSQDAVWDAQARIGQLEARLAESQSQQLALEALYRDLTRNRDEWQLAEIEQVLAIASQQLQLARNVPAALLALQLAEARLARTDRPQFMPIRRALARDIDRLKAAPAVDFAAVAARIDNLIGGGGAPPPPLVGRGERTPPPQEPPRRPPPRLLPPPGPAVWTEPSPPRVGWRTRA